MDGQNWKAEVERECDYADLDDADREDRRRAFMAECADELKGAREKDLARIELEDKKARMAAQKRLFKVTAWSEYEGKFLTLPITARDEDEARRFAIAGGASDRITVEEVR